MNPSSKYYDPKYAEAEVYLNGEKEVFAIEADSDQGILVRFKRDSKGDLCFKNGEFEQETKRGNVCIFMPEE